MTSENPNNGNNNNSNKQSYPASAASFQSSLTPQQQQQQHITSELLERGASHKENISGSSNANQQQQRSATPSSSSSLVPSKQESGSLQLRCQNFSSAKFNTSSRAASPIEQPKATTTTTTTKTRSTVFNDNDNEHNDGDERTSNYTTIESLQEEVSNLKKLLEVENSKLDDVSFLSVASKLEPITALPIKSRRLLKAHTGKVLCIDWSQDRRRLVSSSQDGKLIVWDAFPNNGKPEHIVSLPTTWVMTCAFSPSGNFIAGGGLDNKITAFPLQAETASSSSSSSATSSAPAAAASSSSAAAGAAFAATSSTTSTAGDESNSAVLKRKPIGTHTSYTSCCQFLGNDQQILTGSGDSTCALWNVECGALIQSFQGHKLDVLSLDVSPSETGNTFVSVGCDKRALIWDTRIGHCGQNPYVQSFKAHSADINAVKFYPSGDAIMTASDDTTCRLYDLRADREIAVYEKDSILFGINSIDMSISGRLLFAGSSDYTIHVWDAIKCQRICVLYVHENRVSCVRVSADGTALGSASWDNTIRIWA